MLTSYVISQYLADIGFFTGYFREYTFQGQSGSWQEIPDNNGLNIEVLKMINFLLNKISKYEGKK